MEKTYVLVNPDTGLVLDEVAPPPDLTEARWLVEVLSTAVQPYVVAEEIMNGEYRYLP